jgi:hypothetical protein
VRLRKLASSRVGYGYRRLTVLLRREGWSVLTTAGNVDVMVKKWAQSSLTAPLSGGHLASSVTVF